MASHSADAVPEPFVKKLAIDYLLEGESVKTNPHLRAFAASTLPHALRHDINYKSWASIKSKALRKEIAEASAAAQRIPRAVKKAQDARRGGVYDRIDATEGDTPSTSQPDDPLGDGTGCVFFDLCSGKGFLSLFLAHRYPKSKVVMIDSNKKMNLNHLKSLEGRVSFHCLDLHADETLELMRNMTEAYGKRASLILGVHLCGDLSRRAIELWNESNADALVLSPCCLVHEVKEARRIKGRFGYGLPKLAKKTGWDAYGLWCRFLFHHCGMTGDGENNDGKINPRFGPPRKDLDRDDDMITEKNAFLSVSRGVPLGDVCVPCAEVEGLSI
ncbi:SAM-dependent methyltransferase [bacterium]|nr:SAM-dependent methyltransferase [bacterium]